MTTGEKIRKSRIKKGMTQEELGKILGVQRAAINKYENGSIVNLKRSTIVKLCNALEIDPAWLIGDGDNSKDGDLQERAKNPPLILEADGDLIGSAISKAMSKIQPEDVTLAVKSNAFSLDDLKYIRSVIDKQIDIYETKRKELENHVSVS